MYRIRRHASSQRSGYVAVHFLVYSLFVPSSVIDRCLESTSLDFRSHIRLPLPISMLRPSTHVLIHPRVSLAVGHASPLEAKARGAQLRHPGDASCRWTLKVGEPPIHANSPPPLACYGGRTSLMYSTYAYTPAISPCMLHAICSTPCPGYLNARATGLFVVCCLGI